MGQISPFKPIAMVVEDDVFQRAEVATLLEECEMGVHDSRTRRWQCKSILSIVPCKFNRPLFVVSSGKKHC
jgi:hypothetical protein